MGRGRLLEIFRSFVEWRFLARRVATIPADRTAHEPAFTDG
jgi:hypothetical protein